jgi:Zinc knuckle
MEEQEQASRKSGKGKTKSYDGQRTTSGSDELKGHVYILGVPGQVEKYLKTTEAIAEYAGKTYGREMWMLVQEREETKFNEPVDPGDKASRAQVEKYKMLIKAAADDEKEYKRHKHQLFRTIIGQCVPTMRNKLKSLVDYKEIEKKDDVVGLLNKIRELVYSTENTQYEYWTMQSAMRVLITMKQHEKESLASYSRRFLAQQEVTEDMWGKLIPNKMKGKATDEQNKARDKYLACVFLAGVDRMKYKSAIDELNNDFLSGHVNYPDDVTGALALLSNRRGGGASNKKFDAIRDGIGEVSFVQKSVRYRQKVKCFRCGKMGHIARECGKSSDSEDESDGASNAQSDYGSVKSSVSKTSKTSKASKVNKKSSWSG